MTDTKGTNATQEALVASLKRSSPTDDALAAALRGLSSRAESDRLVDVAYASVDSPYGELFLAATAAASSSSGSRTSAPTACWSSSPPRSRLASWSPRARLDPARRELDAYFEGTLTAFTTPVDWRLAHGFADKVLHVVASIPYGETLSYGEVAGARGQPASLPCRGHGMRDQPRAPDRPLPPRGAGGRQPRQLRRRPGDEALAAGDGGRRGRG